VDVQSIFPIETLTEGRITSYYLLDSGKVNAYNFSRILDITGKQDIGL